MIPKSMIGTSRQIADTRKATVVSVYCSGLGSSTSA